MQFAAISSIFVFAAVASAFTGLTPEQETFLKFCTGGACSQDKRQTLGISAEAFPNWMYQCAVKCSSCVVQNCFAYTDLVAHPTCDYLGVNSAEWKHCRGCRNNCCRGDGGSRVCCPRDQPSCWP